MSVKRVFLIVLDSYGIGFLPDAEKFGDVGANTLASIVKSPKYSTPNMEKIGLFNIEGVTCRPGVSKPSAAFARMGEASMGKDTTIGHWEIAGVISPEPMPVYPDGFPEEVLTPFREQTGRGVLCNKPYSGTDVIRDYGEEHMRTGDLIVYTSADSVFQIAAHEDVVPLSELYDCCKKAREILTGRHAVGRVIARPFTGEAPNFTRTRNRHDFSLLPPKRTMLVSLQEHGFDTYGIGKIYDIFAGQGIAHTESIQNNEDGMEKTIALMDKDFTGLCFVNLVDFDMVYGHRNDIDGYAAAATTFDRQLGMMMEKMREDDVVLITADHGCDPGFPGTDHSREYTPMLLYGQPVRSGVSLGTRGTFADIAATVLDMFGIPEHLDGKSFWDKVKTDNRGKLLEMEEKKDVAGLGSPGHKRTVYVVGHKNPDTDSICSAISYAYLKNQTCGECQYVPARAGQVSAETQYVLERFQVDTPALLENIGTRVKDMDIRKVPGVRRDISLKNAWTLMTTQNVFTLPITNEKNQLEGLITINDIAKSYMEEYDSAIVSVARTPYRNLLETLDAEMIVGDPDGYFDQGKVVIAAANPDVMENYIEEHDMVVLGNRYESQLCAIEMQAGCIVVCLGAPVSRTIKRLAEERNCTIIVTPLDTYAVARLINQSMPVDFFMRKENLMTFRLADYTEAIRDTMSKKRYRDFPILDKKGKYVGMISRRNLLGVHKRGLILVDHNEVSQAVDNVLDAEILEIIDHHRLGSLETMTPVYFRNQPVGCTATIIYQMFCEQKVEIPQAIAGLLCSAIVSDTLVFRSPTCTAADVNAARALEKIAGIECEAYAQNMFAAGSDLKSKTNEEILYQDFKKFEFGDLNIGIGQITSMNADELKNIKDRLLPYISEVYQTSDMDMIFFMLTDIIQESTELICCGKDSDELTEEAFHQKAEGGCAQLPGVVSRKKQLVPAFMMAISQL